MRIKKVDLLTSNGFQANGELYPTITGLEKTGEHKGRRGVQPSICGVALSLNLREFFYFFEIRHCEKYTQLLVHKKKLFNSLSVGDHAWSTDVLEVSERWKGDDISKKIDLDLDMANVRQAMNILAKFRE
ncbi:hypothetical protein L3X38_011832 [Prunus dulcis]|uniref:Uncharacterized protein n=1 Tax=Prunus dulcis TaxID=3755 RepID=A0AAD4ZFS9_PRUDU|nr:hypothetical protein L3X38_011832 [Prunus dulcis]